MTVGVKLNTKLHHGLAWCYSYGRSVGAHARTPLCTPDQLLQKANVAVGLLVLEIQNNLGTQAQMKLSCSNNSTSLLHSLNIISYE